MPVVAAVDASVELVDVLDDESDVTVLVLDASVSAA